MDQRLIGLFSELEKIGVNKGLSHFTQSRGGRRPIRVDKLLEKEKAFLPKAQDDDASEDGKDHEMEGGLGMGEGATEG
jgi:hypothetical protein